jgi:hypothetical protein
VKSFSLLKIPVLLVGFGALLIFAPACKAQSEVNPDHFDGTDPWEVAARHPVTAKAKPGAASVSYQAQNKKASSGANLQLAAAREVPGPAQQSSLVLLLS